MVNHTSSVLPEGHAGSGGGHGAALPANDDAGRLASCVRTHLDPAAARWLDEVRNLEDRSGPGHDGDGTGRTSARTIEVIDPGTGSRVTELAAASAEDVDVAVATARRAFEDGRWSERDADHREAALHALADLVEKHAATLTDLESLDTGKPRGQAALDIAEVAAVLHYYAGWANKIAGTVLPAPRRYFAAAIPEPLGVCAAITPWNYPLPILTYKLAPAIAFGNTFVAKPSAHASLSSRYLLDLIPESGIAPGVVNIVFGGTEPGQALAGHPDIDKIAFTGSTATGEQVMRQAAKNVTKVALELGGKSAHIVFADADLDAAIAAVMDGIWTNAGQVCVAGSRLLIQECVQAEFLAELSRRTAALTLGHGLTPGTDIGPLITAAQRDRTLALVQDATHRGAQVLAGGAAPDGDGFFMRPTILQGLPINDPLVTDELFAPVLVTHTFRTETDAVQLANTSRFGLAAGLWTSDAGRIHRVARQLRAGTIWANSYGVFHHTLPFGGVKGSGFGRELGPSAIASYTETKTLLLDTTIGAPHA